MAYLPHELLLEVVHGLDSIYDIRAFRLVCRAWATVGYPALAHHMTVLNTNITLKEFTEFFQQSPAAGTYTKQLTIFHIQWPVCPRTEWETYPLLLGGQKVWADCAGSLDPAMDEAYAAYEEFVSTESARTCSGESTIAHTLLHSLPNLTTLAINPLDTWSSHQRNQIHHLSFIKRLWMWPSHGHIQNVVRWVLPAVCHFSNITRLEISGVFRPYSPTIRLDHILHLRINSLDTIGGRNRDLIDFLMAFPKVQELSLVMKKTNPVLVIPLYTLSLPCLRSLYIGRLNVSERSVYQFVKAQPYLASLTFSNIRMVAGSWVSLFAQIQQLRRPMRIRGN